MRTKNFSCFPAAVAVLGCVLSAPAYGAEIVRTPDLRGFTRVEAHSAFEVEIRQGESFRVEVRADDSTADALDVRVSGDRLVLQVNQRRTGWFETGHPRATITMPKLVEFSGSGATRTRISGFRSTQPMHVELSGSSRVEAAFDAGDTSLNLSGSSRVELAGRGGAVKVNASGASQADLTDFVAQSASVNSSGASRIKLTTDGRLDVDSSGASKITYAGNPKLGRINTSGASAARAN